eukprot:Gb_22544 [translate_table: standard]
MEGEMPLLHHKDNALLPLTLFRFRSTIGGGWRFLGGLVLVFMVSMGAMLVHESRGLSMHKMSRVWHSLEVPMGGSPTKCIRRVLLIAMALLLFPSWFSSALQKLGFALCFGALYGPRFSFASTWELPPYSITLYFGALHGA